MRLKLKNVHNASWNVRRANDDAFRCVATYIACLCPGGAVEGARARVKRVMEFLRFKKTLKLP